MDSLKVETLLTKDGTRYHLAPRDETLSFDKGFFLAVKAIQILRQKNEGVTVVGIAGPSGSGKTSLAKKIVAIVPKSAVLAMDNYLDSSRKIIDENYDDYRLIDFALLVKNITDLKEGRATETPLYDFRKSGRYAYKTVHPPESKVVILEGTYALHDELRPLLDLKISVSGGVHFDLVKRIMRDIQRTGQEPIEALSQITETVFPMYKAFIEPDLKYADLKIVNNFNPFSGLLTPIYSLKSGKEVDPASVIALLDKDDAKDPRTQKYYDIYLHPPDVKPLNCKDWIRIRNSGGLYSIMFSEEIKEGGFIISPRVDFVVNVKILGGLMALGYQVGAIIHRQSTEWRGKKIIISFDKIEELGRTFLQIKGFDRQAVQEAAEKLGLEGSYIPRSYIELYQEKLGPLKADTRAHL